MSNKLSVIMYHYVRDLHLDTNKNLKGLDLKLFEEQLIYLKKHYCFIDAQQLFTYYKEGEPLPKKAVLLTFDDGYIDHYANVFPLLYHHKVSGAFYVPGKAVLEHKVLDVNKIHYILALEPDTDKLLKRLQTELLRYQKTYHLEDFETYYKKLAIANRFDSKEVIFIKRLLQVELDEQLRGMIVDTLFSELTGMSEKTFAKTFYMNIPQLKEMADAGMHIGSHGYNHYWWNRLDRYSLEQEIDLSLDFLRTIGINTSSWSACYPYGSADANAVDVLQKKGCDFAFTTEVGIADLKNTNKLLLPRLDTNDIPKNSHSSPNHWYTQG